MATVRVHYRERQRLSAADLLAEQAYRLGMAGRHVLAPHRWGVVRGLQLLQDEQDLVVSPGLAVDGYGREIVVPAPVRFPNVDFAACTVVLLHYCEEPEQMPAARCAEDPAPRTGHRFRLVAAAPRGLPSREDDALAGVVAGVRPSPWPLLLGAAGEGCADRIETDPLIVLRAVPYVRARAASLRSSSGRSDLRLGLESRSEIYPFLLNTGAPGEVRERRLGIDRDGRVHVWRALQILGTKGRGEAFISANAAISVELPMISSAVLPRPVIELLLDPSGPVLIGSLLEPGRLRATAPAVKVAKTKKLETQLAFAPGRSALVQLFTGGTPAAPFSQPPGERAFTRAAFSSVSVEMRPFGGVLALRERPAEVEPAARKDCEPAPIAITEPPAVPSALQLAPGLDTTPGATRREVQAITMRPDDPVPRAALRISGGEQVDGDDSSRFAIGVRKGTDWVPAIVLKGSGAMRFGRPSNEKPAPVAIEVRGTVFLPPIGKDDPVMPNLMALAFNRGLLQMGQVTSEVKLLISEKPVKIVNGEKLKYKFTVQRTAGVLPVQIKRCDEIVKAVAGGSGTVLHTVEDVPNVLADNTVHTVAVERDAFSIGATKATIGLSLLVKIGTANRVVVGESDAIPVEDEE